MKRLVFAVWALVVGFILAGFSGCGLEMRDGPATEVEAEDSKADGDERVDGPSSGVESVSEGTSPPVSELEPKSEPEAGSEAGASGFVGVKEVAEAKVLEMSENTTDLIVQASGKTPKGEPFVIGEAVAVPTLAEGGFADEPAFVEEFAPDWAESQEDWRVATWTQNKTKMAKSRARTNGEGHMVLTVLGGEPPRGGSLQTDREFPYGRWIARVRPSAVSGVLNSIFTKDWDDLETGEANNDGRKAEVDIEFLTHTFGPDRGEVHLAIHLANKHPLWHVDIPVDFNPSDGFREWGFDILPDRVVWHVDGKILFAWIYTDEYFVDENYEFFFNAWTNKRWIQGPPEEDADYHIDWLKFYPLEK